MFSDSRELVGMALKALGHSANSGSHAQLNEARELLVRQRSNNSANRYFEKRSQFRDRLGDW